MLTFKEMRLRLFARMTAWKDTHVWSRVVGVRSPQCPPTLATVRRAPQVKAFGGWRSISALVLIQLILSGTSVEGGSTMAFQVRATYDQAIELVALKGTLFTVPPSPEKLSSMVREIIVGEKGYPDDTEVHIDGHDPMAMVLVVEGGSWELV